MKEWYILCLSYHHYGILEAVGCEVKLCGWQLQPTPNCHGTLWKNEDHRSMCISKKRHTEQKHYLKEGRSEI